MQGQRWDRDMV